MCSSLSILCWPPNLFLFQTILPEAQLIHGDAHKYELGSQNTALSVFHHQHQRSHRTYNVPCKLLLAWALAFSCKGLPQICPPQKVYFFFLFFVLRTLLSPSFSQHPSSSLSHDHFQRPSLGSLTKRTHPVPSSFAP